MRYRPNPCPCSTACRRRRARGPAPDGPVSAVACVARFQGVLGAFYSWFIDTSAPPEGAGAGAHACSKVAAPVVERCRRRRSRASSGARKPLRRRKRPGGPPRGRRGRRPRRAHRAGGAEARAPSAEPLAGTSPSGTGQRRRTREPAKNAGVLVERQRDRADDVSRAYCGYDEAYFHDRPRELASQEKAGTSGARRRRRARGRREPRGRAALVQGRRARGGRGAAPAAEARQNYKRRRRRICGWRRRRRPHPPRSTRGSTSCASAPRATSRRIRSCDGRGRRSMGQFRRPRGRPGCG